MASWRDTTPQPVQDDLDRLLSVGLDFAGQFLAKHGEFFPFAVAVAVDSADEVGLVAADPGPGEAPPSLDVLETLYAAIAGHRDGYRAVAFVSAVTADGVDAGSVEAEHRDGPSIACIAPYRLKGLVRKSVVFGDVRAADGEHRIWT